jgi:lipopolysaccharide heptosyltransferase I
MNHPRERILVVRLGSMGDVIHTLPAVATLKHSFGGCRLTWVIDPKWAPLIEGNPFVDDVPLFNRRSWSSIRAAWHSLRRERFDLAIDFQGLIKSALVAAAARPEQLIGYNRTSARESLAAMFYSTGVPARPVHVVDRALDLARAAGANNVVCSFPLPPGRPEADLPAGRFVLASPFAGWPAKEWPLEYYAELAELLRTHDLELVLDGPPRAAPHLRAIPGVRLHLAGLVGLIYATRRATAVVGVDSGPLHLAAALSKPGVAIFGPTDPARNGPYGRSITVLRADGAPTTYKRGREIAPSMRASRPAAVADALVAAIAVDAAGSAGR